MSETRELANKFREIADLYDELANIEENDELDAQQKEKATEVVLGKIIVKTMTLE